MNARPLYLRADGESFFALFHPAGGDLAVLMCPPFGWEDVCSYRSRREWADRLAATGHPTLRFDLPGTGDSAGSPHDPGRVEAWTAATVEAAAFLRAETGAARTVAIGIGLGGLLAWRASALGAPIDDLVLWAVPARGSAYVRELRAFARIETSSIVAAGAPEPPPLPEGMLAPGGFVLSAETTAALAAIDLTELPAPRGRVLFLDRDGLAPHADLVRRAGDATVAPGDGYAEMMARPDEARPPLAVFERVDTWLGEAEPRRIAPRSDDAAVLELGSIRETPFEVAQPFGELFGILAEPVDVPSADLCAVLLNAAAVRRIGPNRMWVEIARRWAGRGIPTLRLDLAGIGDSEGDSSRYADVAELYVPEFVEQARAVLDVLEERGLPRRFILLGLCSGAFWSFHAALDDERVTAAVLLNSRVLFWEDALEAARDLRRMRTHLFRAGQWRRVLRGDLDVSPRRVLSALIAQRSRRDRSADVERAFDCLRESDTRVVFAFTDGEPLHEELERDGFLARLGEWPNLELELVPGRDHTLRPLWMQPHAHEVVDRALVRELERAARVGSPRGSLSV